MTKLLLRVSTRIVAASEHAIGVLVRVGAYFVISWLSGPDVQGQFALFIATQTLAMTIASLALDVANAVIVARKPVDSRGFILVNSALALIFTSTIMAAGILAAGSLGGFVGFDAAVLAMLAGASFISTIGLGLGGMLIGAYAFNWRAVSAAGGALACFAGFTLAARDGALTFTEAAGLWTVNIFVVNLVLIVGSAKISEGPWHRLGSLFKEQRALAMKSYPYFISTNLLMRIGTFVVAYFLGTDRLGVFAIALAATEVLLNLPRLFVALVIGNAANKRGDVAQLLGVVHSLLLVSALVAAPILAFLLEHLLPQSFSGVGVIGLILLGGIVPFGLGTLAANHLLGRGLGSTASWCAIISTVIAAVLLPLGTWLFGLVGAAVATTIVQILFAALTLAALSRAEAIPFSAIVAPRLPYRLIRV